jgi:hypothetical protein
VATTTNPNTSNRALVPRAINPDNPGPPASRMRHLARLDLGWRYAPPRSAASRPARPAARSN